MSRLARLPAVVAPDLAGRAGRAPRVDRVRERVAYWTAALQAEDVASRSQLVALAARRARARGAAGGLLA